MILLPPEHIHSAAVLCGCSLSQNLLSLCSVHLGQRKITLSRLTKDLTCTRFGTRIEEGGSVFVALTCTSHIEYEQLKRVPIFVNISSNISSKAALLEDRMRRCLGRLRSVKNGDRVIVGGGWPEMLVAMEVLSIMRIQNEHSTDLSVISALRSLGDSLFLYSSHINVACGMSWSQSLYRVQAVEREIRNSLELDQKDSVLKVLEPMSRNKLFSILKSVPCPIHADESNECECVLDCSMIKSESMKSAISFVSFALKRLKARNCVDSIH